MRAHELQGVLIDDGRHIGMQRDALEGGYRYFDFRGVEGYPVPENPYYGLHHYKQGFGAQFHAYVGQCDRVLHPMRAKLVHTLQKIFVRE